MTGCLPIALDKATRVIEVLLTSGKEYVGIMHLHNTVSEEKLKKFSDGFIGKKIQIPPIKSAVKRRPRVREIYYLEIIEIQNKDVLFKIGSEAGFYVRKFVHDFGKELGVNAHLSQLVRTKVGIFNDKNWHSLHELKDAYEFYKTGDESFIGRVIMPFEHAVDHMSKIWILDSTVDSICHGSQLALPGISKLHSIINKGDKIAIMTLKDELVAIGTSLLTSREMINQKNDIAIKTNKVFMSRGVYPRYIKNK